MHIIICSISCILNSHRLLLKLRNYPLSLLHFKPFNVRISVALRRAVVMNHIIFCQTCKCLSISLP